MELKRDLWLQFDEAKEANGLFKNKHQPQLVALFGLPGVGKSDIIPIIRKLYLAQMKGVKGWDYHDSDALMFVKPGTSQFFEGYKEQPFMLLDDWAQVHTPELLAQAVCEIITLINTAPAVLDMAKAELKGKTKFNSKVVFFSTNVRDFNIFKMADTNALGRRFTMAIEVIRNKDLPSDGDLTLEQIDEAWSLRLSDHIGDVNKGGLKIPQFYELFPDLENDGKWKRTRTGPLSKIVTVLTDHMKKDEKRRTFADRLKLNTATLQGHDACWVTEMENRISDYFSESAVCQGRGKGKEKEKDVLTEDSSDGIDFDFQALADTLVIETDEDSSFDSGEYCEPALTELPEIVVKVPVPEYLDTAEFGLVQDTSSEAYLMNRSFYNSRDTQTYYTVHGEQRTCPPKFSEFVYHDLPETSKRHFSKGITTVIEEDHLFFSGWDKSQYEYKGVGNWIKSFFSRDINAKVNEICDQDFHQDIMTHAYSLAKLRKEQGYNVNLPVHHDVSSYGIDYSLDAYFAVGFNLPYSQRDFVFVPRGVTSMDANTWIYSCFLKTGRNCQIAIWDYMLKQYKKTKTTEVWYHNAWGAHDTQEYLYMSPNKPDPFMITDIDKYVGFAHNSLPWKIKTRVVMFARMGLDVNFACLGVVALTAAAVVAIIAATCALADVETPPEFQKNSRGNRWKHSYRHDGGKYNHYEARLERVTKHQNADFQAPAGELQRSLSFIKNHYFVKFIFKNGETGEVYGLFMDDKYFAFPYHAYAAEWSIENPCIKVEFYPDMPEFGVATCLVLEQGFTIRRVDDSRDLGALYVTKGSVPCVSSIWGCVPKKELLAGVKSENVRRIIKATLNGKQIYGLEGPFQVEYINNSPIKTSFGEYSDVFLNFYRAFNGKGVNGDCGFPYEIGKGYDFSLLGLHFARCGDDSFIVPIVKEDKDIFSASFQMPLGSELLVDPDHEGEHVPGAKYLGKWKGKGFSSPPKSDYYVVLPELRDYVEEENPDEVKYPAVISGKAKSNRMNSTMNFGATPVSFDNLVVTPGWSNEFHNLERQHGVWDFETALFGDPAKGIKSMATSSKFVGWYFDETKTQLVNFDIKECSPELRKRVFDYLDEAETKPVRPIACTFAKDELLAKEKVEKPECRIINGHDLAYNIALRMVFGDFMNDFILHPSVTAGAIGLDPVSSDWANLRATVDKFPNIIAGDLSKQEATTTSPFKDGFSQMMYDTYDYTPKQRNVAGNLLEGLNGYFFIYNGCIYATLRGHSSGHFLTTLYNSYMVWCGHKYAFEKSVPGHKFTDHVMLKVCGDDSIGSVSDFVAQKYNMQVISKVFFDTFGVKYTSPDKKAKEVPKFIVKDSSFDMFLGRNFIRENGMVLGRLRMESINDMLIYSVPVAGMSERSVIQVRTNQAFKELALYDEWTYNTKRSFVLASWHKRSKANKPSILSWSQNRKLVFRNWYGNDTKPRTEEVDLDNNKAISC
jgi:hypothetical protein